MKLSRSEETALRISIAEKLRVSSDLGWGQLYLIHQCRIYGLRDSTSLHDLLRITWGRFFGLPDVATDEQIKKAATGLHLLSLFHTGPMLFPDHSSPFCSLGLWPMHEDCEELLARLSEMKRASQTWLNKVLSKARD